MGPLSSALNGLSLGQQPPHPQAATSAMPSAQEQGNWGAPDNMMFYQNGSTPQSGAWADHRSGPQLL